MMHRFSPPARRSLAGAATLAARAGRPTVGTDCLLLALARDSDVAPLLDRHGAGGDAVRAVVARRWGWDERPDDGALLAALGIDLGEVRRRLPAGAGGDGGDGWRLERSRLRPLRVSLIGPTGSHVLSGGARKVVEVALWRGRRRGGTLAGDVDLLVGISCDWSSRAGQVLHELVPVPCLLVDLHAGGSAA